MFYFDNNDIGKLSSDFLESRIIIYLDNMYWFGKIVFESYLFIGNVWWYKFSLEILVLWLESCINDSENKVFDYGFNISIDI